MVSLSQSLSRSGALTSACLHVHVGRALLFSFLVALNVVMTSHVGSSPKVIRTVSDTFPKLTSGTPKSSNTGAHEAIEKCAGCIRNNCGGLSAHSKGVSPMASVGKARSCPLAQSPGTKLHIMPIENETVDEGIADEATEVQRPLLLWSDVDRPSLKSNTMSHLDMPSIELGVMRA